MPPRSLVRLVDRCRCLVDALVQTGDLTRAAIVAGPWEGHDRVIGERLRVDPPNVNGSVTAWDVRTGVAVTFRTWTDLMSYLNAHDIPWTDLTDDKRDGYQLVLGAVPAEFDRLTTRIG